MGATDGNDGDGDGAGEDRTERELAAAAARGELLGELKVLPGYVALLTPGVATGHLARCCAPGELRDDRNLCLVAM